MKCMRVSCTNEAAVAIKVSIPPVGYPIEGGMLVHAIMGVKACQSCFDQTKPEHVIGSDEARGHFTFAAQAAGKVLPDFDRAFLTPVPLGGEEFAMYERMRNRSMN